MLNPTCPAALPGTRSGLAAAAYGCAVVTCTALCSFWCAEQGMQGKDLATLQTSVEVKDLPVFVFVCMCPYAGAGVINKPAYVLRLCLVLCY